MNIRTISALLSSLLLAVPAGCYTGLDEGGRADPTLGGGDDDGAGSPGDDGPSREPTDQEPPPPFEVPTDEARLLPFPVRMQNLAHVTGRSLDGPMFLSLYELRYQLGDHDFASGVAADARWSADKMQAWVRGLQPVCTSAAMQERYPELLTDPRPMMRNAWGREPAAEEVDAMTDLLGPTVPADRQYVMTCTAILTALDFVSV